MRSRKIGSKPDDSWPERKSRGKAHAPGRSRVAIATRTSRTRKPEGMTIEEWQVALRREFGREQDFLLENLGGHPIFSEFQVTNAKTGGIYRVAIRGRAPGDNFCSCPDFSVNTLGTCKHVEFTLGRLERKRGARATFRNGFRPPYSEIYLRYGARREVAFKRGEGCSPRLLELAATHFDAMGFLKPESYFLFDEIVREAGGHGHEVRLYEDAVQFIAQVRDEASRRARIQRAFPEGTASAAFEGLLKAPLYPYQREGALFAARAGRSLIADDMGLGKTVQALAAAEVLAGSGGAERALVICPTSLRHQWQDEIERFTNRSALTVQGLRTARAACYESESFFKITNYDVVYRDADLIRRWGPDLIILDEAQRIKNWKTRTAQSVKKLASPYAIVLTGTPLENRLEELHSIVEFVDRFRLGPTFRFLAEHQETDDFGKVVGYKNLSRIAETLSPILLRRNKASVRLELPERLEKTFFVEMTPEQLVHHEENREIVARLVAKWRRYKFLSDADQRRLQMALQNMRMSCNSTYLLDQRTDYGRKADEAVALLEEIFERPEAKAVVFSQWVRTHEILIRKLNAKKLGHVFFHGGVPGKDRKDLIHRFKRDPEIRVFLSTDAGGVGLNLQNAEAVLNMDLPWNPAVLDQRVGRVHRMGQHRPVLAVHFVAEGTIEHGMINLLAFKKSLFAGVLDGGEDAVFLGGTRLGRFMEAVEEATGTIPAAPQAQEAQPAEAEQEALAEETPAAQPGPPLVPELPEPAGPSAPSAEPPWADVVTAGLSFLEKLGQALKQPTGEVGVMRAETMVEHDPATGRAFLKLPMPDPETMTRIAGFFAALAGKRQG